MANDIHRKSVTKDFNDSMPTQAMTNLNDRFTKVKANLPAKNSPKVVQEDPMLPVHDRWITCIRLRPQIYPLQAKDTENRNLPKHRKRVPLINTITYKKEYGKSP